MKLESEIHENNALLNKIKQLQNILQVLSFVYVEVLLVKYTFLTFFRLKKTPKHFKGVKTFYSLILEDFSEEAL